MPESRDEEAECVERETDDVPVFSKGTCSIGLDIVSVGGEVDEADRAFAWELYCEIITRVGVIGKLDHRGEHTFIGELLCDSMSSLSAFFQEARGLMRRYPVDRSGPDPEKANRLGFFVAGMLEAVIRPFLEKWRARYDYWWEQQSDASLPPFSRQAAFPDLAEMQRDWIGLRQFCRDSAAELAARFRFPELTRRVPAEMQQKWLDETERVISGL